MTEYKNNFQEIEMYDWMPFYKELSQRIASIPEVDPKEELLRKARDCFGEDSSFLKYGKNAIDPFSFLSYITSRSKLFPKIKEIFELTAEEPTDTIYPMTNPQRQYFFPDKNINEDETDILWRVFTKVVKANTLEEALSKEDFDRILTIKNVAITKFSTILFLINPELFYVLDNKLTLLGIIDEKQLNNINYEDYVRIGKEIKDTFEGCHFAEVNILAYLIFAKDLKISDTYFQINSNVYGDGENHIEEFYKRSGVWVGGPTSVKGKMTYPLTSPNRGDIILSHFTKEGNGIGIVLDNTYKELFDKDDYIKVIWINKTTQADAVESSQMLGMSKAHKIRDRFGECYPKTFTLLKTIQELQSSANLENENLETQENTEENNMNNPLNQILYGPPGTGKTYTTIDKALEIIDGTVPKDRSEARERFDELKESGHIEFVTFHQSYGYEEFVEGIGVGLDSDTLKYKLKSGTFKNISDNAKKNYEENIIISKKGNLINTELLLNDFADMVGEEEKNELKVNPKGEKTFLTVTNSEGEFQSFKTSGGVSNQSLTKEIILRDYQQFFNGKIKSKDDIKPRYKSNSEYHGNALYYFLLYQKIKAFQEKQAKTYIMTKTDEKNFVLIIDEINRGNISKIFGELITLIERSKRLGEEEALTVTLPYSQDEFGVPPNLYIIGTMNTADRSIALLDTALRRRFDFVEMMPKHEHRNISTDCKGINLQELLRAMNERIEYLYDRDHCIGHTFFLNIDSFDTLQRTFKNKIISLLQEYFYDDREKIRLVLNDNGFINEKDAPRKLKLGENFEDKKIFFINEDALADPENYKAIYSPEEQNTSDQ